MKEKLIGFAIGVAAVATFLAAFGFKGDAQSENVGRFKLHSTGTVNRNDGNTPSSKTYLLDSATGEVWYENANSWIAIKRPRTATE